MVVFLAYLLLLLLLQIVRNICIYTWHNNISITTIMVSEVMYIVYRARSVGFSATVEMKNLIFIDSYAQKNHLSRSMSLNKLLQLAFAYTKVLDAQDAQRATEEAKKVGKMTPEQLSERVEEYQAFIDAQSQAKPIKPSKKKPKKKK